MVLDSFGLEVTTASAECAKAIDAYYEAVLAYRPFPAWSEAAEEALKHDAHCPTALVLAADCAFCQGDAARAKELLQRAKQGKGKVANTVGGGGYSAAPELAGARRCWREERYLEAWESWVNQGDPSACFEALSKVVARHPEDLFAVKRGQIMGLILGDGARILSIVEAAAAAESAQRRPPPKYFHGMLAFGLEQQGRYEEAEEKAREGLAFEKELGPDAWLDHGLAHALYFQGEDRQEEAVEFLESRSGDWRKEQLHPFLYTHCWWHLALLHCESRDFEAAVAIFDERLWPEGPEGLQQGSDPQVQLNALNLLWRLETRGEGAARQRWARVLSGCRGLTLPAADGAKGSLQHGDLLLDVLLVRALCITAKSDCKPLEDWLACIQAHAKELSAGAGGAEGRGEAYGQIAQQVSELMRLDLPAEATATIARQSQARKELRELRPRWASLGGSEEQRGVLLEAVEGPVVSGEPEKNFSTLFF